MCFGSDPSNNSTTTVVNQVPPSISAGLDTLMGKATSAANQPYQQYQQPRIAGFTPDQQNAFQDVRNANGSYQPDLNAAGNFAAQAGTTNLAGNLGSFGQQQLDQYGSPYTQGVINSTNQEIQRQAGIGDQQIAGQAAQAGAYGGDRATVAQAENQRNALNAIARNTAGLNQANFQQAQGQFNTEQNRGLAANEAQAGLQANAAGQFSGLAGQQQGLGLQGANALSQAGAQQQGLGQQSLNTAYGDFLNQEFFPQAQTNFLSGIVHGYPVGGSQQTSAPGPSTLGQIAGLGLTGAALGNAGAFTGLGNIASSAASGLGNLFGNGAQYSSAIGPGLDGFRSGGIVGYAPGGSVPPSYGVGMMGEVYNPVSGGFISSPAARTPAALLPSVDTLDYSQGYEQPMTPSTYKPDFRPQYAATDAEMMNDASMPPLPSAPPQSAGIGTVESGAGQSAPAAQSSVPYVDAMSGMPLDQVLAITSAAPDTRAAMRAGELGTGPEPDLAAGAFDPKTSPQDPTKTPIAAVPTNTARAPQAGIGTPPAVRPTAKPAQQQTAGIAHPQMQPSPDTTDAARQQAAAPPAGVAGTAPPQQQQAAAEPGFMDRIMQPGNMALMQAGLGMMASRSPYAINAIGEGGHAALQGALQQRQIAATNALRQQQQQMSHQYQMSRVDEIHQRTQEMAKANQDRTDAQRDIAAARTDQQREAAQQRADAAADRLALLQSQQDNKPTAADRKVSQQRAIDEDADKAEQNFIKSRVGADPVSGTRNPTPQQQAQAEDYVIRHHPESNAAKTYLQARDAPRDMPAAKDDALTGRVYNTKNGPKRWTGSGWGDV